MKRYIVGMSVSRERAKFQLTSYSSIIMEHIIKLLVYSDIRPDDVNGWIHTIANWIHRADSVTVKPASKKLSNRDIRSTLFSAMGDELNDYRLAFYWFIAENESGHFNHGGKGKYPEFDVTDDLAHSLMDICYDIMDNTVPLLIDKNDHSLEEYESILRSIFSHLQ